MDATDHIPSLTHLHEFTRARASGRPPHVAQDRRQVTAPSNGRFFAFAYEKFLTGVISFVQAGNRGGALERAVTEASDKMRPSYAAAAKGTAVLLAAWSPSDVKRRQRNVVVVDDDGYELVSLRIHLMFETLRGRLGVFMYFPSKALTPSELAVMETAVALAVRQVDPSAAPVIALARSGTSVFVDPSAALALDRRLFLRAESLAYRDAWATSD